jgi:DNA-binding transcriptional MerR regulator
MVVDPNDSHDPNVDHLRGTTYSFAVSALQFTGGLVLCICSPHMKKLAVETEPIVAPEIPDKLYFRIGEVSQILQVEPYVLRYWESEFPTLAPKKSGTGHRLYRRKDVEMVLELKRLLYEKRFTIEGARLFLDQNKKQAKTTKITAKAKAEEQQEPKGQAMLFGMGVAPEALAEIRQELAELLQALS